MRKRNISFIADKLLWFIILILPLLFAMVFTCASMNNYELIVDDNSYNYVEPSTFSVSNNLMFTLDGRTRLSIFSLSFNSLEDVYLSYDDYDGEIYTYSTRATLFNTPSIYVDYNLNIDTTVLPHKFMFDVFLRYNEDILLLSTDDFSYSYDDESDSYIVSVDLSSIVYSFNFPGYYDLHNEYYKYVIALSFTSFSSTTNIFNTYFNNLNYSLDSWFTFGENDIVYRSFNSIFGSQSNILPIFVEGSFIPKYLTYMAWIYVLHIAFDFLVFIPRLAHKWMGGVYKDEDS